MKSLILRTALAFAVFGYLIAIGLYFTPLSWHFRPDFVLAICPPAFLTTISMTDPSFTTIAVIMAPLNALLYGMVGLLIGLVAKGFGIRKASSGPN